MKLKILLINNSDDINKEYVRLKVLDDCDLNDFALVDTTFTEDGDISNKHRHFYWFPTTLVKKGDFVRLYSGTNTGDKPNIKADVTVHIFYWEQGSPVWNNDGDEASLLEIKVHDIKTVIEKK